MGSGGERRFVAELTTGHLAWDLLRPFPQQDEDDRLAGDAMVAELTGFLADRLGPAPLDDDRRLPQRFYDGLRGSGYLRLQVPRDEGGLGLSDYNTFRGVSAAARVSTTAGFALGTHNGIGLPALLPVLPAGPRRDLVLRLLASGAVTGWADTEPVGAGNDHPTTVAVPLGDGGYALTGDKLFISNGAVADELVISAATPDGDEASCLFIVDTRSAGFRVAATQEIIGFEGLPLAALRLDDVRVPAERVLSSPADDWRQAPLFEPVSARGRLYLVGGTALAIAENCLAHQRHFVRRRAVNGLPLAAYSAVQDQVALSVADVYAMDSVARWCLLGPDDAANVTLRNLDRRAAKNVVTLAGWRVADRTMSLLAAEGAETARSKARRGAAPLPLERLFRDARVLRITGGVDFAVDVWAAEALFARAYSAESAVSADSAPDVAMIASDDLGFAPADVSELSPRNRVHLEAAARGVRQLARDALRLARRHPDATVLATRQRALGAVGRSVGELFAMAVVLARTADHPGDEYVQGLADVFCTAARRRLADLRPDLDEADGGDTALITERWLGSQAPAVADTPVWATA